MDVVTIYKTIPFLRSGIYLLAAGVCLIIVFTFAENNKRNQQLTESVRIMIYNIHHGEGLDGVVDLERIAGVIKKENPDILLLQEVDVNVQRSGFQDIPEKLAELTGLNHYVFGKNIDLEEGQYGNATLSVFPIKQSENFQFEKIGPEQRGVLVTEFSVGQIKLLVMNAHFDHSENDSERVHYTEQSINEILPSYSADAVLFGGDFNDIPGSRTHRKLTEVFHDAWLISGEGDGLTSPADQPSVRIDYIFYNGNIQPAAIWVPETEASDHRPVVADFELTGSQ